MALKNVGSLSPNIPYVAPFAVFLLCLAAQNTISAPPAIIGPIFLLALAVVLWVCSRDVIQLHSSQVLASTGLGIAVLLIWIAPDALIPGYRESWLFQNAITGRMQTSIAPQAFSDPLVLWSRIIRAVVFVPIIEELFWRGWLMRWLIDPRFEKVALGTYRPGAFWITAVLFASEHGPYWDVGLITGVIYNWWMVRTRSLGDCILAHAVTNACLCGYVIATHHWEYWM